MRYRIQYAKQGRARFLGHLDLMRLFQRAARRAGLPLAHSAGFNPHPKMALGPALALGLASVAEYLDLELTAALAPEEIKDRLATQAPDGIAVATVKAIDDRAPALTAAIECASYRADLAGSPAADLAAAIAGLLARDSVRIRRREKEIDIRPGIHALAASDRDGQVALDMVLACGNSFSVRPMEVVAALSLDAQGALYTRTGLFTTCRPPYATPLD